MSSTTIADVISSANGIFGAGSVMKINDKRGIKVPAQRTGIPQLDLTLGIGGIPKGRVIEVFGPESSGKTTLALTIIAQAQKEGAWAWYGDMEHALDPTWAEKLGLNLDKLLISQPSYGEECLKMAEHFIKTGVIDIIVVDSVASLVPQAELTGEMEDANIGLQARMMSKAMRRQTGMLSRTQCTAIYINQIREKIGVTWGSNETTPGGRALKFYSSVRIDVRRKGSIGKKEESTGNTIVFKIVKNKMAAPFRICEADLLFENGFDLGTNLLEAGVSCGLFDKSGRSFSYKDKKLGSSRDEAIAALNNAEEDLIDQIYKDIAGKPIESTEEDLRSKKTNKIAKYMKKYMEAETEELKEKYGKKVKMLGGELPVIAAGG